MVWPSGQKFGYLIPKVLNRGTFPHHVFTVWTLGWQAYSGVMIMLMFTKTTLWNVYHTTTLSIYWQQWRISVQSYDNTHMSSGLQGVFLNEVTPWEVRQSWANAVFEWCYVISTSALPDSCLLTRDSKPAESQPGDAMTCIVKNCQLNVFCPDLNQNTFWPKYIDKAPHSWQEKRDSRPKTQSDVFQEARCLSGI